MIDDPERLYPGLNLQLQLVEETARRPEIAVGLHNAFGQNRLSSEYIVASKRYKSFDFSAGMAWGK
ncbi:MAG: YjbH domain-containing protein, partial [Bdellovibrionales bacterium]